VVLYFYLDMPWKRCGCRWKISQRHARKALSRYPQAAAGSRGSGGDQVSLRTELSRRV